VRGNFIGTDATGTIALANHSDGISIYDSAASNVIGGAVIGAGNLISGNGVDGIYITNVSGTVIQGNSIGTKADGIGALGNTYHNIEIYTGAGNVIGGTAAGAGNRIAFSKTSLRSGVRIRNGMGNLISGNNVFSNALLGIDLGVFDVTPNDACDADSGANALQNFPVLTQAYSDSRSTAVKGFLDATLNSSFRIQFFANATCNAAGNPLGYGQGGTFLGEATLVAGPNCANAFSATLSTPVPAGQFITATATDAANNTSEFSACIPVLPAPTLSVTAAASQIILSWPTGAAGFALKQTGSLNPPILWTLVVTMPVTNGAQNVVSLPLTGTNQFFRLSLE
jgi:hypothetical protein